MVCQFLHIFKWFGDKTIGVFFGFWKKDLCSHLKKLSYIPIVVEDTDTLSQYNYVSLVLVIQLAVLKPPSTQTILCVAHILFNRKKVITPHCCKVEVITIKSEFLHALEKLCNNRTTIPYGNNWNSTADFLIWDMCPPFHPNPHHTLLYLNCSHHLVHFLFGLYRHWFL